jgi:hypothetical protein
VRSLEVAVEELEECWNVHNRNSPNLPIKLFKINFATFFSVSFLGLFFILYISSTKLLNILLTLLKLYPLITSISYPFSFANFNSSLKYQPSHSPNGNIKFVFVLTGSRPK